MNTILTLILLRVFIFTTTFSLQTTATNLIYDSSGNKLLRGTPYYILPLVRGTGGGLTLSQNTKTACPLNVTQEPFEVNHGIPFTFNPIILDEQIIRGAYPISIEADISNPCQESNILKLTTATTLKNNDDDDDDDDELLKSKKDDDHDDKKKKDDDDKKVVNVQTVTTGGEFNKPESCFQFVEDVMMPGLQSYQIQQCPFKCGSSSTSSYTCYNVGIVIDADGKGYLSRTDAIFPVVFTSSYGTFSTSAKVGTFSPLSAKVNTISQSQK